MLKSIFIRLWEEAGIKIDLKIKPISYLNFLFKQSECTLKIKPDANVSGLIFII